MLRTLTVYEMELLRKLILSFYGYSGPAILQPGQRGFMRMEFETGEMAGDGQPVVSIIFTQIGRGTL